MAFFDKIRNIDRRVIFILIALSVALPLLLRISFPEIPTPMVKNVFDQIENMPAGSRVLFAADYDPPSEPELQPMANSIVRHLAQRGCKIYFITLNALGPNMIEDTVNKVLIPEYPEYVYGEDYVNLGYKSGGEGVVKVILTNLRGLYTTDVRGASVDKIAMLEEVKNIKSMGLIISVSTGSPGTKDWVQYGSDPAGIPMVVGCTAVQAPLLYPYYPEQIRGLLGGIKGAAEYDELLRLTYGEKVSQRYRQGCQRWLLAQQEKLKADFTGPELETELARAQNEYEKKLASEKSTLYLGLLRMGPQAVAHMMIILLIVIGNITFIIDRKRRKKNNL